MGIYFSMDRDRFINESVKLDGVNSPEDLMKYMKDIKYNHTGIFLSSDEVISKRYGDCHDQSNLEYEVFRSLGLKTGRIFMVEYSNWYKMCGDTHTITWFYRNGKYYWFEHSWENQRGIHGPYDSLDDLKEDIYSKWNFSKSYDKLFMSNVIASKVKAGMTLNQYCVAVTPEKAPKNYFKRKQ